MLPSHRALVKPKPKHRKRVRKLKPVGPMSDEMQARLLAAQWEVRLPFLEAPKERANWIRRLGFATVFAVAVIYIFNRMSV